MADRAWRSIHLPRRAGRDRRSVEQRPRPRRAPCVAVDLCGGTARPVLPGSNGIQPLSSDAGLARRLSARADAPEAITTMRRSGAIWIAALAGELLLASLGCAQTGVPPDHTATYRADSLRLSGRPWHAAETLLAAARRDPNPNAFLIVEGAKAEVHARRYEHARQLLAGQPWLLDYLDGEALAVLAQAEYGTGRYPDAATHFQMSRARAPSARVPVLAVRAALAFDAAGQPDSSAVAFAAARAGGNLASIDPWLRMRQARVTRDTAAVALLVADLPPPVAREVPVARARALLLAGDTTRALDAFARAGRGGTLDAARLALATGDSTRARTL